MYAKAVLNAMLGKTVTGVIPVHLLTTDRIMQRWAVSTGSGLPSESWDDAPQSRLPELDDHTMIVIDNILNRGPKITKQTVHRWYRTPATTRQIAQALGISSRGLEKRLNVSLEELKDRFILSKHLTLLRLLRVHV